MTTSFCLRTLPEDLARAVQGLDSLKQSIMVGTCRWFHDTLVDGDLAINSMMWQNAGKSGLDQWNFTLLPTSTSQVDWFLTFLSCSWKNPCQAVYLVVSFGSAMAFAECHGCSVHTWSVGAGYFLGDFASCPISLS